MKKIIAFCFLLISLITQGQIDQRIKDSMILFAPTPMGTPDGEPISQMMNNTGGRLISLDKKVELIIPPGALSSETMISIQVVTNLNKAGVGKTYRFEPSGTQFLQPAQLIFHYTDKDTDGDSPQLLSISTQDEKGSWLRLSEIKIDTISKTITGSTLHFTEFVMSWTLVMWAHANRVKVSKEVGVQLYLTPINFPRQETTYEQRTAAHNKWFDYQLQNRRIWSVNGIVNGNAAVGKIINPAPQEFPTYYEMFSVIYLAPAKIPDQNPVEIEIELKGVEMNGKFINVKRTCKVLIYDDVYEINMIATMKGGSIQTWGGNMSYRDEGWFYVSLDKKEPELWKIQNFLEILTYDNCPGRTILNPTTCTGLFHVDGSKQIKVTPANPPDQPFSIVEIWFVPYPIELTRFKFNCPPPPGTKGRSKGKVDLITSAPGQPPPLLMFFGMPALPPYIKFIAKEGEQIIIEQGKPGGDLYYKIWVKRLEEDTL